MFSQSRVRIKILNNIYIKSNYKIHQVEKLEYLYSEHGSPTVRSVFSPGRQKVKKKKKGRKKVYFWRINVRSKQTPLQALLIAAIHSEHAYFVKFYFRRYSACTIIITTTTFSSWIIDVHAQRYMRVFGVLYIFYVNWRVLLTVLIKGGVTGGTKRQCPCKIPRVT